MPVFPGSITVQTMKAPVTLRGSVPQQIMTQQLTAAQQQQLLAASPQETTISTTTATERTDRTKLADTTNASRYGFTSCLD